MPFEVHILATGYSQMINGIMKANCSCTLVTGRKNIIIDTMTPWDKELIINGLAALKLSCDDIHYVVCTHGHSDHIGNNNLFLKAKHIVGFSINFHDNYFIHPFEKGEPYKIEDDIEVIPTPGHTLSHVSVIVKTKSLGIVAITGDLFEKEEDLTDSKLWLEVAGSEDPTSQVKNRKKIIGIANYIIPGHGPMFHVTNEIKQKQKT
uniref:Metallo-beta-lactamase domain-containing protein 1 n=1 Tax=Clastoptera arizonana TaxID=38151 RepID=A0A1B6D001_9HEMI